MESVLIILFVVVVIILITSMRNELQKKFDILNQNFIAVHKQVKAFREEQRTVIKPKETKLSTSSEEVLIKDNAPKLSYQLPVAVIPEKKSEVKDEKKPVPVAEDYHAEVKPPVMADTVKPIIGEKVKEDKALVAKPDSSLKSIFGSGIKEKKSSTTAFHGGDSINREKNQPHDYEKLIGENWLNKIGIAILVVGIGFFVKYAIDKEWIGEWGRLFIGIGTAFAMIGIAHWLRKNYHAFSSVLIGGGVATLYYTISIAYHHYQLFSQPAAFAIMTGITLMASMMATWYNRKELAIISLIGGFSAPFMVAGETNNANVFFTYIAILNAGMLLLSFLKKWIILNRLAFVFTAVYLATWIISFGLVTPGHGATAITFLIVFFAQFLVMNLSYNIRRKTKFNAWEFIHLFTLSGLFYGGMMYTLAATANTEIQGLFTALVAILFFALTIVVKRITTTDANLVHLMVGKTVTFITLTIFMQFDGHYTTLFWALEAVILLWMSQKTNLNLLRQASVIVLVIATGALVIDWTNIYFFTETFLPVVFNKIVATGFFVLASYGACAYLLKKEPEENSFGGFSAHAYRSVLITAMVMGFYLVTLFELIHQADRLNSFIIESQVIWMYHFVFVLGGIIVSLIRKNMLAKQVFFVCGTVVPILFIFAGHNVNVQLRDAVFENPAMLGFYNIHFILTALYAAVLFGLWKLSKPIFEDKRQAGFYTIVLSLFGLFMLTAEMDMIAVHYFADSMADKTSILHHTQVAGYTILWGVYSFMLMIIGMRKKLRAFRIFSLIAFSVTLVKLFAFDIREISEGGKIAAFILLGVMLLVISFLYQKLRRLIVEG